MIMFIYLHKAVSAVMEWFGRHVIFNRFPPPVGAVHRDIPYDDLERRKQSLDVIVPAGSPPYPVFIYIHGGGFHGMDKKSYTRICKCFAARGCLVFNVNYRLAPAAGFPEQFADIGNAIRWAYDNAEEYGGDNSRVFMGGDSAGAYFSSMYAAAVKKPELLGELSIREGVPAECVKGLLLFYGAYDMEDVLATGFPLIKRLSEGFFGEDPELYRQRAQVASPARHVGSDYPSSFLFSSEKDPLHSESVAFEQILNGAGVPTRTLYFSKNEHPLAIHGFLSAFFLRCSRESMREALGFLDGLK